MDFHIFKHETMFILMSASVITGQYEAELRKRKKYATEIVNTV